MKQRPLVRNCLPRFKNQSHEKRVKTSYKKDSAPIQSNSWTLMKGHSPNKNQFFICKKQSAYKIAGCCEADGEIIETFFFFE